MNTDKIYAEQIANEYAPKDTSKVVALRKLDARAKLPSTIFTYSFGIISALILGVGIGCHIRFPFRLFCCGILQLLCSDFLRKSSLLRQALRFQTVQHLLQPAL